MIDINKLREEMVGNDGAIQPPPGKYPTEPNSFKFNCSSCGRFCHKKNVKKDGLNKGRPFLSCAACGCFDWLDMPFCACGRRMYEAQCKKTGKNEGRTFRTCPNSCAFKWVD